VGKVYWYSEIYFFGEKISAMIRHLFQSCVLHYLTLSYTILHYLTLSYTILHYLTLFYTILHYLFLTVGEVMM